MRSSSSPRSPRACLAFAALLAAITRHVAANPAHAVNTRSGGSSSSSNENIPPPVTTPNGTSNATSSAPEDTPLGAGGAGARRGKRGVPPWTGTPVFVVGMPKAGTSTIAAYFECGGVKTSHYVCARGQHCGKCVERNVRAGAPPLSNCGDYDVYAQLDYSGIPGGAIEGVAAVGPGSNTSCYFPQVEALDALSAQFPSATFVLNHRRAIEDWISSVGHWRGLRARLAGCEISGLPRGAAGDEELKAFVAHNVARVRAFVRKHPSHRLVEVYIDDEDAGSAMEKSFSISASCWRHANANPGNANGKDINRRSSMNRSSDRSSDRSSSHHHSNNYSNTYLSAALNFHANLIVQVWFTLPSYALLAGVIVYGLHALSAGRRTT